MQTSFLRPGIHSHYSWKHFRAAPGGYSRLNGCSVPLGQRLEKLGDIQKQAKGERRTIPETKPDGYQGEGMAGQTHPKGLQSLPSRDSFCDPVSMLALDGAVTPGEYHFLKPQ